MKQVHIKLTDFMKEQLERARKIDERTIQSFVVRAVGKYIREILKREGDEQKHTEKKDSRSTKVKKMGYGI